MAEVLGCQRVGKERRNVCKGSRVSYGCRDVPGWVPTVGGWRTTLPHHPSRDVCTCCWVRMERSRKADLLRSLARSSKAEPWGGCSCHPACGVLDFLGGDLDLFHEVYMLKRLPSCHSCMGQKGWKRPPETFCPPWGATYGGGEVLLSWRRTKGGLPCSNSMAQLPHWILLSDPRKGLLTWWSPLGGQGGTPVGIGGCLHAGVKHWKTEQRSRWCTKCWCPCSHSCPWGRSLERHVRSLNWHRPETCDLLQAWGGDVLGWEAPGRTPRALDQRAAGGRQLRPSACPEARVGAFLGDTYDQLGHQG